MFNNAMGLILADNKKISLGELSTPRALSAVPFGGRYRIIDFMLSDIDDSIKDIKLVIAGYIFDGEAVKYVQANGMSDTVEGVSYNEAAEFPGENNDRHPHDEFDDEEL